VRQTRRYALTAETFDVAEARNIGLVHVVCPVDGLDAAAAPIVDALLRGGPIAIRDTKRLIAQTANGFFDDAIADRLARISAAARGTEEAIDGFTAFLAKRPPKWFPES
jgi:methylglutaconyl-CoA hydratase